MPCAGNTASAVGLAIISALAFGLAVGYISFYITFDFQNLVCPQYTTQSACEAPSFASCIWTAKPGAQVVTNSTSLTPSCKYSDYDVVYCPQYSESSCGTVSSCQFNYGTNGCERAVGMTASQIGYFAASFSTGAFFGSWFAVILLSKVSFRVSWITSVLIVLLSAVLHAVARATYLLPLMALAQGLAGLGCGSLRYVTSIYAFRVDPHHGSTIVAALQPVQEVAGLISALYTYFVMPTQFSADPQFEARIYGRDCLMYATVIVALVAGVLMFEPPPPERDDGAESTAAAPIPASGMLMPLLRHPKEMLLGMALCILFLFTPYLALQSFMPLYSKALIGVESAFSVLVFALITTPSGVIALIVRLKVTNGKALAVTGGIVMALATACLGIVVHPGVVSSESAKHGAAIFFIVTLVAAVEICIGSTFFGLALQSQPPEVRTAGGAFMNSMVNGFALIITSTFPTVVTSVSGGPKANQMYGFAACMYFFAALALICAALVGCFLKVYEVEADNEPIAGSGPRGGVQMMKLSDRHEEASVSGSEKPTPEHEGAWRAVTRQPHSFPATPSAH